MIRREFSIFLIVGSLTVLVDFTSYRILLWLHLLSLPICKAIGFIVGTIFAYIVNKCWTFAHKEHARGSLWRFILLYLLTLAANVWVNSLVHSSLNNMSHAILFAFLTATGVSAALNFMGMKWFVFRTFSKSREVL